VQASKYEVTAGDSMANFEAQLIATALAAVQANEEVVRTHVHRLLCMRALSIDAHSPLFLTFLSPLLSRISCC
jgi:hypothetical protein